MTMKKLTLKSPSEPPKDTYERRLKIYWNISTAVRKQTVCKNKIEKQINFVLNVSKNDNPKLDQLFINLRTLNRERNDVRDSLSG